MFKAKVSVNGAACIGSVRHGVKGQSQYKGSALKCVFKKILLCVKLLSNINCVCVCLKKCLRKELPEKGHSKTKCLIVMAKKYISKKNLQTFLK